MTIQLQREEEADREEDVMINNGSESGTKEAEEKEQKEKQGLLLGTESENLQPSIVQQRVKRATTNIPSSYDIFTPCGSPISEGYTSIEDLPDVLDILADTMTAVYRAATSYVSILSSLFQYIFIPFSIPKLNL